MKVAPKFLMGMAMSLVIELSPGEAVRSLIPGAAWFGAGVRLEPGEELIYRKDGAGTGKVVFAPAAPGSFIRLELSPGRRILCRRAAFACAEMGVQIGQSLNGFSLKLVRSIGGNGALISLEGAGAAWIQVPGESLEWTPSSGDLWAQLDCVVAWDAVSLKEILVYPGTDCQQAGALVRFSGEGAAWLGTATEAAAHRSARLFKR